MDIDGNVLMDTLVNPKRQIGFASTIHGITDDMVVQAPTAEELWPKVRDIVSNNHVVIYNAQFDTRFFPDDLACAAKISCAMLRFAKIYGERTKKPGGFKWQKLVKAAEHIGYRWEGDAHRALADVKATCAVWKWMEGKTETVSPPMKRSPVQKSTPITPKKPPNSGPKQVGPSENLQSKATVQEVSTPKTEHVQAYIPKRSIGEKIGLFFEMTFGVLPVMLVMYAMMAMMIGGPIYMILTGLLGLELPIWTIWVSPVVFYAGMFLFKRDKS